MVDISKFWIEGLILEKFPDFASRQGADLNGNGAVEESETLKDINQNGILGDKEDYKAYLTQNYKTLAQIVPFFSWSRRLDIDNRIHQLLYLESDLFNLKFIEGVYIFLRGLTNEVWVSMQDKKTPEKRALQIWRSLEKMGYHYSQEETESFVNSLQHHRVDCDIFTYAAVAVGDEFGWPLSPVLATDPGHMFARWVTPEKTFNIDQDVIGKTDEEYRQKYKKFFKILGDNELEALFLDIRARVLMEKDQYPEALKALELATQKSPHDTLILTDQGFVLNKLGRYEEALAVFNEVLRLDPTDALAHRHKGTSLRHLKRFEEALKSYQSALQNNPEYPDAIYNDICELYKEINQYEEGLKYCNRALQIDPNYTRVQENRKEIIKKLAEKSLLEAKTAYEQGEYKEVIAIVEKTNQLGVYSPELLKLDFMARWHILQIQQNRLRKDEK